MSEDPRQITGWRFATTPLKCEKCGGSAPLESGETVRCEQGTKDILTYRCDLCGAEMTRFVISR